MTAELTPAAQARDLLSRAVAASPADETAITWVERRRFSAASKGTAPRPPAHEHELQVRVVEAGRPGAFRPPSSAPHELAAAVRHAMARARGAERLPDGAGLTPPAPGADQRSDSDLHDPELAALGADAGQRLLRDLGAPGESARLGWCEVAVTVATSRGLVRQLRVTSAALEVRCRRQPGSGSAASVARTLQRLAPETVFARARRRHGGDTVAGEWQAPAAVVLTGEAVVALVAAFSNHVLNAAAWENPGSYGRRHHCTTVTAPEISLVEDPAGPAGLPLPFSRTGAVATAVPLVEDGLLRGPVADPVWAARLDLPATVPVWLGLPPQPDHLAMRPGALAEADLLLRAGDGILIGGLDPIEVWDSGRLAARLVARGVRRIAGGALGEPLPDVAWEVTLPEALAVVHGIGSEVVAREEDFGLGAISAPGLVLGAAGVWRPLG